jgi:hypothetical protein
VIPQDICAATADVLEKGSINTSNRTYYIHKKEESETEQPV